MNILVIEDDKRISDFLVRGLQEQRFSVMLSESAEDARALLSEGNWDLILLDIMLPGIDGIEFTKSIRFKKNYIPILILSALGGVDDKIQALDAGADDYLVKPFHFDELLSRINALVRRNKKLYVEDANILQAGPLMINKNEYSVQNQGESLSLSPQEYRLLLYLIENKNTVLPRTQILKSVWGIDYDNNTNVVDVYISYLRAKIGNTEEKLIHTIKGVGYMLKA